MDKISKYNTVRSRLTLGFALRSISKAVTTCSDDDVIYEAKQGFRYIDEFLNADKIPSNIEFTEKGGILSTNLHTGMRKMGDSIETSLLYSLISGNRGYKIWIMFCNGIAAEKGYEWSLKYTKSGIHYGSDDFDNLAIMYSALSSWGEEGFNNMYEAIKDWE